MPWGARNNNSPATGLLLVCRQLANNNDQGLLGFPVLQATRPGVSVRWPVRLIRIGQVSICVTVVMAKPGHGEGQAILIAAVGDEVEIAAR
jgi:hypothetical protein